MITRKQIEDCGERPHLLIAGIAFGGAVTPRNFARNTPFGRRNQFITVEGGRDSSTNYTIDGVYVRSLRFNNLSLNPPIDAVQEVSLLRNSFSTEYGQGQAVVSIVTKSGTNQMHGSAYEFYRGDRFDAKNFFAPTKPEYKRNQFGATGGGPIMRNRFFVSCVMRVSEPFQVSRSWAASPVRHSSPGFFRARHTGPRPFTGQPFAGTRNSRVPLLEVREYLDADDPGAEAPLAQTTTRYQGHFVTMRTRRRFPGDQTTTQPQLVFSFHVLQRVAAATRDVSRPPICRSADEPRGGSYMGAVVSWVNEGSVSGTTMLCT